MCQGLGDRETTVCGPGRRGGEGTSGAASKQGLEGLGRGRLAGRRGVWGGGVVWGDVGSRGGVGDEAAGVKLGGGSGSCAQFVSRRNGGGLHRRRGHLPSSPDGGGGPGPLPAFLPLRPVSLRPGGRKPGAGLPLRPLLSLLPPPQVPGQQGLVWGAFSERGRARRLSGRVVGQGWGRQRGPTEAGPKPVIRETRPQSSAALAPTTDMSSGTRPGVSVPEPLGAPGDWLSLETPLIVATGRPGRTGSSGW